MRRWGHSSRVTAGPLRRVALAGGLALLLLVPMSGQNRKQPRGQSSKTVSVAGKTPATPKMRIVAGGPVTFEGGASGEIAYTVSIPSRGRPDGSLRERLENEGVRVVRNGGSTTIESAPGTTLAIVGPRPGDLSIESAGGAVTASGVDGRLRVETGGGEISVDRIRGEARLATGGGEIRVGTVDGPLHCTTGAGRITVQSARSRTVLESSGGDIVASEIKGPATLHTAGGTVHVMRAEAAVSAITGGGQVVVDDARGVVTVRNLAGPVRVGRADGVRCESGNGGVRLDNVQGAMRVSTGWGNIVANLLAAVASDSILATGNGDITVAIPSNVGVTIRAENEMADTIKRIVSEFPGLSVRMAGTRVVAEGAVNGGGPVLRISGTGGTIYIKRQNTRGSR